MKLMAQILAVSLTTAVYAQDGVTSAYHELSLRSVFAEVLFLRAAIEHCEGVGELLDDQSQTIGELEEFQNRIVAAFVERAALLHSENRDEKLNAAVSEWVDIQQSGVVDAMRSQAECAQYSLQRINSGLENIRNDNVSDAIEVYATSIPKYLDPLPAFGNETALTFAVPRVQQMIARHISNQLNQSHCPTIRITGVELLDKQDNGAVNLPVFITEPIRYREEWEIDCDGSTMNFEVSFNRDSDSSIGIVSTKAVEQ